VLTGAELDISQRRKLEETVERVSVYARVSPEHKLKIVQALPKAGHIRRHDRRWRQRRPALRQADIGVAMASPARMYPKKPPTWCCWTTTSPPSWQPSKRAGDLR